MSEKKDLQHFLKLALAQVRHRLTQTKEGSRSKTLLLLEDLLKEQLEQK